MHCAIKHDFYALCHKTRFFMQCAIKHVFVGCRLMFWGEQTQGFIKKHTVNNFQFIMWGLLLKPYHKRIIVNGTKNNDNLLFL